MPVGLVWLVIVGWVCGFRLSCLFGGFGVLVDCLFIDYAATWS